MLQPLLVARSYWLRLFAGPVSKVLVGMNHLHIQTYKQKAQIFKH